MKSLIFALLLLVSVPQIVQAESVQAVANRKAQIAANRLIRGHVGGSLGGARYEGVGWGTSPQIALRKCCYSGKRPVMAQAVYKGRDGLYYACRLYR